MAPRRLWYATKTRVVVALDQFLGWPPSAQIAAIVLLTGALVAGWGLLWAEATGAPIPEALWQAAARFMDGGTMATDRGRLLRLLALGVTATGVLVLSFLTGAFASKLSERIQDLKSGRSPVVARDHVLILGFDSKVPLMVREIARSGQRVAVVVLAQEEKQRLEIALKPAQRIEGARVRVLCRSGDPRSELALLNVFADRARAVVIIAPARLDDDHALRWTVSTLLSIRRVVGKDFAGRLVVESRRALHNELLGLAAEGGVAGRSGLRLELFASDDIVARVLAQSIRQGGVYFALRELLSFRGSELYVEPLPHALIGKTFDEVHAEVTGGIAVGVLRKDGSYRLAPPRREATHLVGSDRLIVLEHQLGRMGTGGALPPARVEVPPQPLAWNEATTFLVIGANRTLPRLITEIDRIAVPGSTIQVRAPVLAPAEEEILQAAVRATTHVKVERGVADLASLTLAPSQELLAADAVVILGCEDEQDQDGDASALAILLHLRHQRRVQGAKIRRLVTEVRDISVAQRLDGSADDFLVSNDVVAMVLAQACLEPQLVPAYRELLDPTGTEVFLVPRSVYAPAGPARFADIMAAARLRGEIAIGFFPVQRAAEAACARTRIELGQLELDEESPVLLNPPRDAPVPEGPEAAIVVLADPPEGQNWR